MIRILHIVGVMNRGGAETLLMEIYRHIDRSRVQFDFLVYNYSDQPGAYDEEILSLGGRIYNAERRFYKGPIRYCLELKEFFESHPEYKIVHAHQYKMSGYMLAVAKNVSSPITIAHSHIAFPTVDFLRRCADAVGKKLLDRYSDYYMGCSEDALVALSGKSSDNENRFLLKNAIDTRKFLFSSEKRDEWRKKLEVSTDTLVLGCVARFTYQKNHEFLIKIFEKVLRQNSDSVLVLIGVGSKENEIKQLSMELGVYEKIRFLGSRGDVAEIINAFDIFVLPSRYEGLGIVLIEAQANGLSCVISADVIPDEADVSAGLVKRVSLNQDATVWAKACVNAQRRLKPQVACKAVEVAGYDIQAVSKWLQEFYMSKFDGE